MPTITDNSITVHGRESLVLPFKVTGQDISTWTVYFEVDGIPIREQFVADPNDATGLRLILERDQVELLKKSDCQFSVIDERDSANGIYIVLWTGTIKRIGYVGAPDSVDG
jgi:hypothetical protein